MEALGFTASFLMGIILGLVGGGGSILTVPIMVYLFGVPPTVATGYSLFVVGITALTGSSLYLRKKEVDLKTGFFFAVPSVVTVNMTRAFLLPRIPDDIVNFNGIILTKNVLIMTAFAALMIVASYSMIKKRTADIPTNTRPRLLLVALQGVVVGVLAGFVGAGGGFLIIPALVVWAGLSMRIAVGTSLTIIAFQSLIGFAGDVSRGIPADWRLLLTVSAIAVAGIILGTAFAHKIKEGKLKNAFGWFVLLMGFMILIEQFRSLSPR